MNNKVPNLDQLYEQGLRGQLYILRGVPSSGKSFRARQLVDNDKSKIFSADLFFSPTEDMEEYRREWCVEKLHAAHSWCKSGVQNAMQLGVSPIVVDNTNIKRRDFMPYIDLAKQYQYRYEIRESESPWWAEIRPLLENTQKNEKLLAKWASKLANGFKYGDIVIKNSHGVPEATILRMLMSFQPYHGGEYASKE
jgi:predicted kinase